MDYYISIEGLLPLLYVLSILRTIPIRSIMRPRILRIFMLRFEFFNHSFISAGGIRRDACQSYSFPTLAFLIVKIHLRGRSEKNRCFQFYPTIDRVFRIPKLLTSNNNIDAGYFFWYHQLSYFLTFRNSGSNSLSFRSKKKLTLWRWNRLGNLMKSLLITLSKNGQPIKY